MVDSNDYDQGSSTLRKAKKPRIPKRGPGVAELEKILREQEQKDNGYRVDNKVASSISIPSLLHREPTADFPFPMLTSNGSDYTKMMDFFQSSSTPVGVYNHHVEPPSNQKHYTSTLWHEEYDKMKGTKRSRPNFPVENWRSGTPTRMPYQPICPQVSRLDSSSSSTNSGVFYLGISRDPWDHGNPNGSRNLVTLESPTTPLPSTLNCQPDLSKFIKQFPFQENTEGSLLQRSSTEAEISVYNKSFVSFLLQPEDLQRGNAVEATLCLKNEKCCADKTGDFIDLNLKL